MRLSSNIQKITQLTLFLLFTSLTTCLSQNNGNEEVVSEVFDLFAKNKYADALKLCDERLADDEGDVIYHFFKAEAYHNLNDEKSSDKEMAYVYNFKPDTARDYSELSQIALIYGDLKGAYSHIVSALKLSNPNVVDEQAALLVTQAALLKELASLNNTSNYDTITTVYEKALASKKTVSQGKTIYALKGSFERLCGNVDASIATFKASTVEYTDFALGYMNLGFMLSERGDYIEALLVSNEIINRVNKGTSNAIDRDFVGNVVSSQEDVDNILPFIYNNRGYAKYKLNDLEGAMTDVDYAILMLPENSYAHRNRALINIATGNIKNACTDLQKAIDLGFLKDYGIEVQILKDKHCSKP